MPSSVVHARLSTSGFATTPSEERAQKAGLWSSHLVKCPITRDQLEHFQCYFTFAYFNAILTVAKKYRYYSHNLEIWKQTSVKLKVAHF